MEERNNIETVWRIEDNKLKKSNKVVSKIKYDNLEFAFVKSQFESGVVNYLVKDNNNEYWDLHLFLIDIGRVKGLITDDVEPQEYRKYLKETIEKLSLDEFFTKKIELGKYFNLCELEYISKYHPELYENALECRNNILEQRKLEEEKEQAEREKVAIKTNLEFDEKVEQIKYTIYSKGEVQSEELKFYKDNQYRNGITTQNCFLYLAKMYGIEIPISVKGFINNKLVSYDFGKTMCSYTGKRRTTIYLPEYMDKIYQKVCEEKQIKKVKKQDRER